MTVSNPRLGFKGLSSAGAHRGPTSDCDRKMRRTRKRRSEEGYDSAVVKEKRPDQPAMTEQSELERLTIASIFEHRALLAEAEAADEVLQAAGADPGLLPEDRETLEAACVKSRLTLTAQQLALNNLINRLGYVPDVPPAGTDRRRLN